MWLAATFGALCIAVGTTNAQPGTAIDRFRSLWEAARSWDPQENTLYSLRVEWHSPLTAEEIEQRMSEIGDLPDHPDHIDLILFRQYLRNGPSVRSMRLWWMGRENFRLSRDNNLGDGRPGVVAFSDSVVTPQSAWSLVAGQLHAFDPGGPYPRTTTSLRRKTRRCTACTSCSSARWQRHDPAVTRLLPRGRSMARSRVWQSGRTVAF